MSREMDWNRLMSLKRHRGKLGLRPDSPKKSEVRSPFVKDADKIIYCSAFRRLQNKTQVHTFPGSDYVRTRLTHSLEVAAVGRSLGIKLGHHLIDVKGKKIHPKSAVTPLERADFGSVVAAACLAHDIGNPPFGHAGEQAIRHWFKQECPKLLLQDLTFEQCADLQCFEGNAQGFRIITRLQAWRDEGGLRLTCATLGAFQKYPTGSCRTIPEKSQKKEVRNKFGYFQQDRAAFETVAKELGLLPRDKRDGTWCRHPLAFLVEAADDICNTIADIEDGYKYNKIDFRKVAKELREIAKFGGAGVKSNKEISRDNDDIVAYLRAQAIDVLISQVMQVYKDNESEIIRGTFTKDGVDANLMDEVKLNTELRSVLKRIEDICRKKLFHDGSTLRAELAGFEVIRGLLEVYTPALQAWENNHFTTEGLPSRHDKAIKLLQKSTPTIPEERYEWLIRVTDYISGMTDNFAVDLYRRLKGISVGGVLR